MHLGELLEELEQAGLRNDAAAREKDAMMLNITRDTGEFLAVLVKAMRARRILEIGTSNGYSTLWLASSLEEGGKVVTVECLPAKAQLARRNFERAGLAERIELVQADAAEFLRVRPAPFDLVFLDADRRQYMSAAREIVAAVRPGGVLVCDNAVSHAAELAEFVGHIRGLGSFACCLVPVGKGEFVACKALGG